MSVPSTEAIVLSQDLVDFMLGPISMKAGSCNKGLVPSVSQAYGCRVSRTSRECIADEVCVFLSESRSATVLDDLRNGGRFSVVFSRPTTHRTVQLKASSVRFEPLQSGDKALIELYCQRAVSELVSLGYTLAFSQALMAPEITDAVCVCFVVSAAFDQTPGVGAGLALGVLRE